MPTLFKTTSLILSGFLSISSVLSGCSSSTSTQSNGNIVTVEKAPTNFLKRVALINSSSTPSETEGLIPEMIRISQQDSKTGYLFTAGLVIESPTVVNNTLDVSTTEYSIYNVRIPTLNYVYELEERWNGSTVSYYLKQQGTQEFAGIYFSAANPTENIWGNEHAKIKVEKIEKEKRSEENSNPANLAQSLAYFASYPFEEWFTDGNIRPLRYPEQYQFSLTQQGEDYIWTITLADPERATTTYIQDLWTTDQINLKDIQRDGSFIVDSYDFLTTYYILTMNQNGALKSFQYADSMKVSKNSESREVAYNDYYTAQPASSSWTIFFEALFEAVWKENLKEGDEFTLLEVQSLPSSN